MTATGPAKRVIISVGEHVRSHREPVYLAVLQHLLKAGVAAATVTKGVAGFGPDHRLHTARILELSENLPITIAFIASAEEVDALLPSLLPLVTAGVVEVQDTQVVHLADGK